MLETIFSPLFFQAALTGVLIAAPVGPVALMVMRYSLVQGTVAGLTMGVGTALADSVMGIIVGLSMSFLSQWLTQMSFWIQLIGGCALVAWGSRNLLNHVRTTDEVRLPYDNPVLIAPFAFILTILSPSTFLLFLTVYTTLAGPTITMQETASFSSGVFCGALTWWIFVSVALGHARKKISKQWLARISHISAMVIAGLGVLAIIYAFFGPSLIDCASQQRR